MHGLLPAARLRFFIERSSFDERLDLSQLGELAQDFFS
jgi:hypothetical protein